MYHTKIFSFLLLFFSISFASAFASESEISLEAFDFNIPVVTQPTDFINGRFTNGFYQLMDIEGLSAKNEEEYSEIVTKLINDPEYLQEIKLKIKDNKYKLFEQNDSITDWSEFLLGLRNK